MALPTTFKELGDADYLPPVVVTGTARKKIPSSPKLPPTPCPHHWHLQCNHLMHEGFIFHDITVMGQVESVGETEMQHDEEVWRLDNRFYLYQWADFIQIAGSHFQVLHPVFIIHQELVQSVCKNSLSFHTALWALHTVWHCDCSWAASTHVP